AGRARFTEVQRTGKEAVYRLVGIEDSDYLAVVLERARHGAHPAALSAALVEAEPSASLEGADADIGELINQQVLVPDLLPAVTGSEPIHGLVAQLREHAVGTPVAERLEQARTALEALDAAGVGVAPAGYRTMARLLEELPVKADLPRLFQVD